MSRPTYRGAVVTEAGARDWENRGEADMPVQSARGVPAHITWTRGAQQPDCTIAEFRQRRPFWHRSVKMGLAIERQLFCPVDDSYFGRLITTM